MKQILSSLILVILMTASAFAGPCEMALGNAFTSAQQVGLCKARWLLNLTTATVAGAGTNQATAAALSANAVVHRITGADGTVAWRLPAITLPLVGTTLILLNTTAGVANIFPSTGGTINGAAADAVFTALTGIKPIICATTAANTWVCS